MQTFISKCKCIKQLNSCALKHCLSFLNYDVVFKTVKPRNKTLFCIFLLILLFRGVRWLSSPEVLKVATLRK